MRCQLLPATPRFVCLFPSLSLFSFTLTLPPLPAPTKSPPHICTASFCPPSPPSSVLFKFLPSVCLFLSFPPPCLPVYSLTLLLYCLAFSLASCCTCILFSVLRLLSCQCVCCTCISPSCLSPCCHFVSSLPTAPVMCLYRPGCHFAWPTKFYCCSRGELTPC
jgi:hypothetical protein